MRRALLALVVAGLALALVVEGAPGGDAHAATRCVKHAKRVVRHVKRHGKRTRVVEIKHRRVCKPAPESGSPSPPATPPSGGSGTAPGAGATPAPGGPAAESPGGNPGPETGTEGEGEPEPEGGSEEEEGPGSEGEPEGEGEPEPEANALGVAADDHEGKSYTLSRGIVHAGRLTVQLQNKGEDPHDMEMQRIGPEGEALGTPVEVPVTAPGKNTTQTVEVEAGEYRMWCNLYHHAQEGMEATVTVE